MKVAKAKANYRHNTVWRVSRPTGENGTWVSEEDVSAFQLIPGNVTINPLIGCDWLVSRSGFVKRHAIGEIIRPSTLR